MSATGPALPGAGADGNAPRRPTRRPAGLFVATVAGAFAAVVLAGLLAGCSVVRSYVDTQQALHDAGYQSVHVGYSRAPGGGDEVTVGVSVGVAPTDATDRDVASIVWRKLHQRFDLLEVSAHGRGATLRRSYTFAQLQATFGARNPAWNRTTVGSAARQGAIVAVAVLAAVACAVTLVIVLLVRRRNRRRPPPAAGPGAPLWPPPGGPPPGGPPWQPPPGDGGWGRPPGSG